MIDAYLASPFKPKSEEASKALRLTALFEDRSRVDQFIQKGVPATTLLLDDIFYHHPLSYLNYLMSLGARRSPEQQKP